MALIMSPSKLKSGKIAFLKGSFVNHCRPLNQVFIYSHRCRNFNHTVIWDCKIRKFIHELHLQIRLKAEDKKYNHIKAGIRSDISIHSKK